MIQPPTLSAHQPDTATNASTDTKLSMSLDWRAKDTRVPRQVLPTQQHFAATRNYAPTAASAVHPRKSSLPEEHARMRSSTSRQASSQTAEASAFPMSASSITSRASMQRLPAMSLSVVRPNMMMQKAMPSADLAAHALLAALPSPSATGDGQDHSICT